MIEMYILAAIALVAAGAATGILMMVRPKIDRDYRSGGALADATDLRESALPGG